jgi:glycosyltransferase involved in cell wall biosynthesis
MKIPDCSVIIATYGREQVLFETIDSLQSSQQVKFELIVVDQNKKVSQYFKDEVKRLTATPNIKWIKSKVPSLTKARNNGRGHANSDLIIYVDDDVLVDPLFLKYYVDAFGAHPEVDAVVGPVYDASHNEVAACDYHDEISKAIRLPLISDLPSGGYTVGGIGCNMAFRRQSLHELGGFNIRFKGGGGGVREESEVFMRLCMNQKKVYFEPKCGLQHLSHNSGGCGSRANRSLRQYVKFFNAYYFNHTLFADAAAVDKGEWLKYMIGTVNTVAFYNVTWLKGAVRWCLHMTLASWSIIIVKADSK